MRRILSFLIIITAAFYLPGLQSPAAAEDAWTLESGIGFSQGLFYNKSWDPGFGGASITIELERRSGILIIGAGAEAGLGYSGASLLFPLRAGLVLAEGGSLSLATSAALLPGMLLSRPAPYFLLAAELAASLGWRVSNDFGLTLTAAPRYTVSPEYSSTVAPLESLDLSIRLSAGFTTGK